MLRPLAVFWHESGRWEGWRKEGQITWNTCWKKDKDNLLGDGTTPSVKLPKLLVPLLPPGKTRDILLEIQIQIFLEKSQTFIVVCRSLRLWWMKTWLERFSLAFSYLDSEWGCPDFLSIYGPWHFQRFSLLEQPCTLVQVVQQWNPIRPVFMVENAVSWSKSEMIREMGMSIGHCQKSIFDVW